LGKDKEEKMQRIKTLVLFAMAATVLALIVCPNSQAGECRDLQGFTICTDTQFYTQSPDGGEVTFKYTVKKTSGSAKVLNYIDLLIPGNVGFGTCNRCLLEDWNCANIETRFGNSGLEPPIVANVTYHAKRGTPISNFGAGISDKRALRAVILKNVGTTPIRFWVRFKNQTSPPKSGNAYVQLTKPVNAYDSDKMLGPDELAKGEFGILKSANVPTKECDFIAADLENEVFTYYVGTSSFPLPKNPIGTLAARVFFPGDPPEAPSVQGTVTAATDKATGGTGTNTCYYYMWNGSWYGYCY
jgi:hypothetical protein